MGYIKHHAIIVTGVGIEDLHLIATDLFGGLVGPVIISVCNGYETFIIAPDGSKEGRDDSNEYNGKRKQFTDYLQTEYGWVNFVELSFGGDEDCAEIITQK